MVVMDIRGVVEPTTGEAEKCRKWDLIGVIVGEPIQVDITGWTGLTASVGESRLGIIFIETEAGTEGADGAETESIVILGLDLLCSNTVG